MRTQPLCWVPTILRLRVRRWTSDSSVATAATAARAVDFSTTNEEFDEWLQCRDHLTNEGLQDITLHSYLTLARRTTREQYKSIRD
eukprot:742769-Pyramimonas_sp.AAC.1